MRITICDICKHKDGIQNEGGWRLSFRDKSRGMKLTIDACDVHKHWLKQFKTFDEADKAWTNLILHR